MQQVTTEDDSDEPKKDQGQAEDLWGHKCWIEKHDKCEESQNRIRDDLDRPLHSRGVKW